MLNEIKLRFVSRHFSKNIARKNVSFSFFQYKDLFSEVELLLKCTFYLGSLIHVCPGRRCGFSSLFMPLARNPSGIPCRFPLSLFLGMLMSALKRKQNLKSETILVI